MIELTLTAFIGLGFRYIPFNYHFARKQDENGDRNKPNGKDSVPVVRLTKDTIGFFPLQNPKKRPGVQENV